LAVLFFFLNIEPSALYRDDLGGEDCNVRIDSLRMIAISVFTVAGVISQWCI
jgi:hypothetical protein